MTPAIRAEWAKSWSDPGTAWLLAGVVVSTVSVGVLVAAASRCPAAGCVTDPAKTSLAGVYLGQALATLVGVLAIGGEYGTGMIRVTLTAMPRRDTMLIAKALVLTCQLLVASALAAGGSMLAGWLILPGHWFGGAEWRASFCAMVYLTLIAALSLGVTTVMRDSAAAAGTVLGLLFLFPVAASLVSDRTLERHLEQISPLLAGMDSQAVSGLRNLPLSPWQGLGVVALWAVGALLLGGVLLRLRDV